MQISLNEKTKDHLVHRYNLNEFAPNPPPTKKKTQTKNNKPTSPYKQFKHSHMDMGRGSDQ